MQEVELRPSLTTPVYTWAYDVVEVGQEQKSQFVFAHVESQHMERNEKHNGDGWGGGLSVSHASVLNCTR